MATSGGINAAAAAAFREGRISDCSSILGRAPAKSDADKVLEAEVFALLGRGNEADGAVKTLIRKELDHDLLARSIVIVGDNAWNAGELESALSHYQSALLNAEKSGDLELACRIRALVLERTCESTGFDRSLPLAAAVRRAVIRSDDLQVHALVHLTFGRLEARAGRYAVAHRHFDLARTLLNDAPNFFLLASLDLDESVALWLAGDIAAAIELAERGAHLASKIGWVRGRVSAAGNLASLYVCAGRIGEAKTQIQQALSEPFSTPSTRIALADTRVRAFLAAGDLASAERIIAETPVDSRVRAWYQLFFEQTQIEVLLAKSCWQEALERSIAAQRLASQSRLNQLHAFFQLAKCEAMVGLQLPLESLDLTFGEWPNWPLRILADYYLLLGKALQSTSQRPRSIAHATRARRILVEAGDIVAANRIELSQSNASSNYDNHAKGPTHLDAAVAVLELSGHPHILGREAYALIQDASCADAVALVASGSRGVRIIACDGWSTDEALAVVKSAASEDRIDLGQHRAETWTLLARPHSSLEHRCTLGAIRKLITTARALDQYRRDEKQRAALWPADTLEGDTESLWLSEQSIELLQLARRVAPGNLSILLTGETGTGKEMLARVIHRASLRADRPFVPFNCTAVPHEMLESQLFGHRKGAFTGADASFPGVIRSANGGTLFLDEIGDIGIELQPKLLRFLEQQEVHPLGESQPIKVDVRIVAATNANLEVLVAQGRFREDLLYRLKVIPMHLPPLRERREEIPALVQHYLQKYGDEQRKPRLSLGDETLEYLLLYSWPGNIRQLANEVRRIVALAEPGSTVTPTLLSPEVRASRRTVPTDDKPAEPEIRLRLDQPLPAAVEALEQTLVRHALDKSHGRVEEAARLLGISRKGLFLKRRRWGIQQVS